jgi:hypothetical protein
MSHHPKNYSIARNIELDFSIPPSIHAFGCFQRCVLPQAGQTNANRIPSMDSNLIFSVVNPVGTVLPNTGQRIRMFGIAAKPH